MNNQINIQYCITCYEKKMKQLEGTERHKSHVWIRQPEKVIWRECHLSRDLSADRKGTVEMNI